MKLKILTTSREIRQYLKRFNNEIIPKVMSIGEFLDKAIIVKDKKFVDEYLKKIYLFNAIKEVDVEKLGINREFLSFFKNSDFIFGFFNEVYLEKVDLDKVSLADTYVEFGEHLDILKLIYKNYKQLLEKDSFVDKITIDEFSINEEFINQFETIDIEVLGYLTKFDLDILNKISQIKNIDITFMLTKYNKLLIKKMFKKEFNEFGRYTIDFKTKDVKSFEELRGDIDVEVSSFSDRISQVNFVLASIEEFIQKDNLDIEKIAVIVPDEDFGEYLKLFKNEKFNINFSFGDSFTKSEFFIKLKAVQEYIISKDKISFEKAKDWIEDIKDISSLEVLLDFFEDKLSKNEAFVSKEEFYKIKKILPFLQNNKENLIMFLLDRLKDLSFDDTNGGKVTAMGVLESRGVEFDGVIIVDFNEGVVPSVSDKDFFLNTAIRDKVNLPNRGDKEALQKNYYYNLLLNAKKVKISYVKNEENNPSRFLYELGLEDGENKDYFYKDVLFKFNKNHKRFSYDGKQLHINSLTPTSFFDLYSCQRRYYFKYILKISNDIDEVDNFGTIFHKAIEKVVKKDISGEDEYFKLLMDEILKQKSKKDIFEIRSKWEDKIKKFCKIDFNRVNNYKNTEQFGGKILSNISLQAKYDRIDEEFVYDYKTGKKPKKDDISKDYIQALFYNYIFDKKALFYYIKDEKDIEEIIEIENCDEQLNDLINSVEPIVKATDDENNCKWCDYKFVCGRE